MIVKGLRVAVTSKEIQFLARSDISRLDHENATPRGGLYFQLHKPQRSL